MPGFDAVVPGERAVGREVIKVQVASEFLHHQLLQHSPRASGVNVKNAEGGGGNAPDPVLLAIVFKAGFVAAQLILPGNTP